MNDINLTNIVDDYITEESSNITDKMDIIDVDVEYIVENLISDFEEELGEVLRSGDERKMFLDGFAYAFAEQAININEAARSNLLRYAEGEQLDALGEFYGNSRQPALTSKVTIKFTLSSLQNQTVIIPQGTRVTPNGEIFFATSKELVFTSNESVLSKEVECIGTVPGENHNDFAVGEIDKLVDGNPYVESVTNTTVSSGGRDIETDTEYRKRLRLSPFGFAVAGPQKSYEYIALSVSGDIGDVSVYSPSAGVVEIAVLMKDGSVPSNEDEILNSILKACSDKNKRPLTDKVQVVPATATNININVNYYVADGELSKMKEVENAVSEYIKWQTEKIGRDINPDKLKNLILNAGASRVDIVEPIFKELLSNQVAKIGTTKINFKGYITV